jgi:curli production assembly/transport component CsgF
MLKKIPCLVLLLMCQSTVAGELSYTPINPSFGGSPLNGAFLLSTATAQNNYKAKTPPTDPPLTDAQKQDKAFKDGLNRQVLSRLQKIILTKAFPTTGTDTEPSLAEGVTTVGDYTVSNNTTTNTISITNTLTGDVLVNIDLSQVAP